MHKAARKYICILLLLVPSLVFGQAQTTGRVTGTVVDEEGNPVAGARVSFISSNLQGERVLRTSENGKFLAAVLPVGPYAVEFVAPGMQPLSVSFRLGLGETVPLDVTLEKGEEIVEEVTVYAPAAPLETTALGANFDYTKQVEGLPINRRQITTVASYGPNIQYDPGRCELHGFHPSIAGAPSYDNSVLLDATEVSDPYYGVEAHYFIADTIEEVQLMVGGVSARYGRFQGGVINAVTKTGGNTFAGTVRAEFANESWNSKTPYSGEEQSDELNQLYQATLGGFILKDHLWFFGALWTKPDSSETRTTVVTGENFETLETQLRGQFKLRGAVTSDHVIEAAYYERNLSLQDRSGFIPAGNLDAIGLADNPYTIVGLTYQGVLTPELFLDLQVTKKKHELRSGGDPAGFDPVWDSTAGAAFNNAWFNYDDPDIRDKDTLGINVTQVLTTANWGTHTVEYGVQYVDSITGGDNNQSATGYALLAWDFPSPPTYVGRRSDGLDVFNVLNYYTGGTQLNYRWVSLPLGGDQSIGNLALYAQETWQVGKWRFDAGLRWERYEGEGPRQTQQFDFDAVAPRVGATYNIDRNWQVQATYGKYVSRFNDGVFGGTTGIGSAPRLESFYDGGDCWADPALNVGNTLSDGVTPIDPGQDGCDAHDIATILRDDGSWDTFTYALDPDQPSEFLDTNIVAPYADDFNFSVRRALPRNSGTLVFAYVHRGFNALIDDFVGAVCDDFDYTYLGGECSNTTDIFDPNDDLLTTLDTKIWGNTDTAKRDYDGFSVAANWTPSAKWGVGGNYTCARTEGNYEGEGHTSPASGSPIGDWERGRPNEAAVVSGPLDMDVTHRLRSWGTYRFSFDRAGALVLGAIVGYQGGYVWNKTAAVPRSAVPEYSRQPRAYTHYFDGRGNNRFNDWWSLDLSARYQFPIFRRLTGWLKVSTTNVLNNDTLATFQTTGLADQSGVFPGWEPAGTCGVEDAPSEDCTGFGRIRNEDDYQFPRSWLFTLGLQF